MLSRMQFVGIIEVRPLLLQFEIDAAYEQVINTNGSAIIYAGTLIRRNARADKPAAGESIFYSKCVTRSLVLVTFAACVCKYAHACAQI